MTVIFFQGILGHWCEVFAYASRQPQSIHISGYLMIPLNFPSEQYHLHDKVCTHGCYCIACSVIASPGHSGLRGAILCLHSTGVEIGRRPNEFFPLASSGLSEDERRHTNVSKLWSQENWTSISSECHYVCWMSLSVGIGIKGHGTLCLIHIPSKQPMLWRLYDGYMTQDREKDERKWPIVRISHHNTAILEQWPVSYHSY